MVGFRAVLRRRAEAFLEVSRVAIALAVGDCTPFGIHAVAPEEFEGWYSRFIDKYVGV